jgi:hypothetical protein
METNRSTCTTHDCDERTVVERLVQLRLQKKQGIQNLSNAKECFAIQVEVKYGATVTLFLLKNANVGDLKQAVDVKTAIAPAQQALQFMGKMLTADYQSIVAAGLRNKSTVTMIVITQGALLFKPAKSKLAFRSRVDSKREYQPVIIKSVRSKHELVGVS